MRRIASLCVLMVFMVSIRTIHCDILRCWNVSDPANERLDEQGVKWFNWARLYSFCRHRYVENDNSNITSIRRCSENENCSQCMDVCHKKEIENSTCKNCKTEHCTMGCNFFFFLKTNKGNFKIDRTDVPHISQQKIYLKPTYGHVEVSWDPVYPQSSSHLPSVYLLALNQIKINKVIILGLIEDLRYNVSAKEMCERYYDVYQKVTDNRQRSILFPVNQNGPSPSEIEVADILSNYSLKSNYAKPSLPDTQVEVHNGSFYSKQSDDPDKPILIWNLTWSQINNTMVQQLFYNYSVVKEDSCKGYDDIMIPNWDTWGKIFVPNNNQGIVKIENTEDDKLAQCTIAVDLWAKYDDCFTKNIKTIKLAYTNCHHVKNYTGPCITPTPVPISTEVDFKSMNHTIAFSRCSKLGSSTYNDCENVTYTVKLKWHPYTKYPVRSYTIGYRVGYAKEFTKLNTKNTNMSLTVQTKANVNNIPLHVYVYARTDHSKDIDWDVVGYIRAGIVVQLKPPHPTPTQSPHPKPHRKNNVTITVVSIIGCFAILAGICLKVYRDRTRRAQNHRPNASRYQTNQGKELSFIPDEWEIFPEHIEIASKLGEGAFGTVHSARIKMEMISKSKFANRCGGLELMNEKAKLVAVKFLKAGAGLDDRRAFEGEIALMKKVGYHKNIVNMIGCSTLKQPLCLIVEYMYNGDLLNYLRKQRRKAVAANEDALESVTLNELMSFAWQIACAMEYLASQNIVHRDLAARNVLVGQDKKVKVSDFGLSRQISNDPIYLSKSSRKIPVKWMSIEAIFHKEFSAQSDVWSYGVTLFEIVTLGGAPYPNIGNVELCKMLKLGYRMERPDNCSVKMHHIMRHCWNETPSRRPTFMEIREHLEKLMESGSVYFSFDIDYSKAYYNVASFKSISDDEDDEPSLFDKEFEEKPIHCKSVEAASAAVLVEMSENDEDSVPDRYISADAITTPTGLDNRGFHFTEVEL